MPNSIRLLDFGLIDSAWKGCGSVALTATLCILLVEQPLLAEAVVKNVPAAKAHEIQGQERVLHALNRLTFGPRPGEVDAVQKMGLNAWLERQLNPASIDDSGLDTKLAEYPAMQMKLNDLERKYPGPQRLKKMIEGKASLPEDKLERAMVEDQIAFYKMARVRAETTKSGGSAGAGVTMGAPAVGAAGTEEPSGALIEGSGRKAKAAHSQSGAMGPEPGMVGEAANKMISASEISAEASVPGLGGAAGANAYPHSDVEHILALSPDERVRAIMALAPADLVRFRASVRPREMIQLNAGLAPAQREMLVALQGSVRMVALEAMESRVMRDIYSERQLEAVMTDFWLNHFNVYMRKNHHEPYLIPSYERETIRPRALGKFEDLLVATAKSPAMLVYLDNFRSTGPNSMAATRATRLQQMRPDAPAGKLLNSGLNENYGRELMELHTLGVNGGYTQADVTNVAKVFTGWGLDRPYQGGAYQFDERKHEPGKKVVLGKAIGKAGEAEGMEVLHMLATSAATAHFISEKLAVRFVSDAPPSTLVDRMAGSFLSSKGDIKAVLRTMFNSPEFWAPDVDRAKVKTPLEFVVSAARASNLQVANPQSLVQSLDKLGMPLYGMQTPNGYSWKQDGWVSTGALVSRMNFSLVMSADKLPGTRTEWSSLLGDRPAGVAAASYEASNPPAVKEARLESILLGQPASERTRATVLAQSTDRTMSEQAEVHFDLNSGEQRNYMPRGNRAGRGANGPGPDDPQAAVMAGLLLGSPEFQRR